jgi:hypothetical protein
MLIRADRRTDTHSDRQTDRQNDRGTKRLADWTTWQNKWALFAIMRMGPKTHLHERIWGVNRRTWLITGIMGIMESYSTRNNFLLFFTKVWEATLASVGFAKSLHSILLAACHQITAYSTSTNWVEPPILQRLSVIIIPVVVIKISTFNYHSNLLKSEMRLVADCCTLPCTTHHAALLYWDYKKRSHGLTTYTDPVTVPFMLRRVSFHFPPAV